jgi:hypothetical protein
MIFGVGHLKRMADRLRGPTQKIVIHFFAGCLKHPTLKIRFLVSDA